MFDFSGNVGITDWGVNIGWGNPYPNSGGYYGGVYGPNYGGVVYRDPRDNSQILMVGLLVLAVVLLSK